jgi:hypothetical protein
METTHEPRVCDNCKKSDSCFVIYKRVGPEFGPGRKTLTLLKLCKACTADAYRLFEYEMVRNGNLPEGPRGG